MAREFDRFSIKINPIKIVTEKSTLAVIDGKSFCKEDEQHAWLLVENIKEPIKISNLIKKKIYHIFLDEKQIILKTRKEHYLITWGCSPNLQLQDLVKLNIR